MRPTENANRRVTNPIAGGISLTPLRPFLKWPGGKRWAAQRIADLVRPHLTGRYYEPFLGGGAVFFHLRPRKATLSDANNELIEVYEAVRTSHKQVTQRLRGLTVSRSMYYEVRSRQPDVLVDRAARFLYLNRTGFGGMYRLNQEGHFNVPYGGGTRTPEVLWNTGLLENAAAALKAVTLRTCDFAKSMMHAGPGDVVYCDPTYTVAHGHNGFIRYNERNFLWSDQERLAEAAYKAQRRGAVVIISNAHHKSIRELYGKRARLIRLQRMSCMSPDPRFRRKVMEYLIVLRPEPRPEL